MIFGIFTALILGVVLGLAGDTWYIPHLLASKDFFLGLLLFSVGISIGQHKGILQEIKKYHFKALLIPLGIVIGSVTGGYVANFLTSYSLRESLAIACGLGWYSLSGVTISNLAGPEVGSIAFLSNLMRELIAFALVMPIARHLPYLCCIAPAAATSEDTLLPMLMKYTDEETVVLAIFNGVVCSALVPPLIALCFA